ncbi:Cytochrome c, class I [Trichormus variabilis ATCC 29413]|uniref:Cytochrome c, class I n=2 Tax=Anabaena variabilis TaxID=264691 RepID=Q3M9H9_TRIV2|nr:MULTISPECIES: c-type cytochrome [Nostocaceae]ABA22357.1 Cytochrome c, class I [Trichormus variabilis ATCC 29413]MBC1213246.1 c-type cytochrome [Trichormus variabilis ARAD]MBC1255738.1 c-type cytochrome [Trichormus variabilis V5]MBC1268074.1 c-type cytochrome [Trichormus variabilis FSR]MBC1301789.1 c-type cytochrome [Trichormus variabilis N2B]
MRIILLLLLLAIATFKITFISPALAAELPTGAKIFNNNCASCHIGGGNILISEKTLKKEALLKYLEDYETNSIQAIIHQVQYGKNAMPAFKDKLSTEEILEVAAYIFQKAEKDWSNLEKEG